MSGERKRAPRLPPRWFVRAAWAAHRAVYAFSGGRFGMWLATPKGSGMMRLRTTGRRTGAERVAMLGYVEDGANLVTVAMNGWADPEPAATVSRLPRFAGPGRWHGLQRVRN